jgi:hypothetical protein
MRYQETSLAPDEDSLSLTHSKFGRIINPKMMGLLPESTILSFLCLYKDFLFSRM